MSLDVFDGWWVVEREIKKVTCACMQLCRVRERVAAALKTDRWMDECGRRWIQ